MTNTNYNPNLFKKRTALNNQLGDLQICQQQLNAKKLHLDQAKKKQEEIYLLINTFKQDLYTKTVELVTSIQNKLDKNPGIDPSLQLELVDKLLEQILASQFADLHRLEHNVLQQEAEIQHIELMLHTSQGLPQSHS